jgi:hypothetical protein
MRRATVLVMAMLLLAGCYARPRSGVTPAPPGPIDLVNILIRQDYNRLCPDHYDYCQAGKRSICCPNGGCCEDSSGPYCCDTGSYDRRDYSYDERDREVEQHDEARGPCGPRSTTCARGGRTICCAEYEGCCADRRGLYCCAATDDGDQRDRY